MVWFVMIIWRPMRSYTVKAVLTTILAMMLLMPGCTDSESTEPKERGQNDPRLIGAWQQAAIGKEKVSGIIVKLIFSERTLTMDAPGCKIIGDYTTADPVFTYTVTETQGENCAPAQKPGVNDSVHYRVTESQLFLTPLSAGEESRTEYKRIKDDNNP